MTLNRSTVFPALFALVAAICPLQGNAAGDRSLAHTLLKDLVEVNTAPSGGDDIRPAAHIAAKYLLDAGFDKEDVRVIGPTPKRSMVVARYRSIKAMRPPILLLAHLDVVEALPQDWSVPPFKLTERDGYFYGRGSGDDKAGAAILVANFVRLWQEGFEPDRDLIIVLSADEETDGASTQWLLREHRDLVDAAYALNTDAGGVLSDAEGAKKYAFMVQTGEKVYASYSFEAHDRGGHSSLPRPDNPIYRVARTLVALQHYRFPVDLNDTTREFFKESIKLVPPESQPLLQALSAGKIDAGVEAGLEQAPYFNSIARTTCVATQLEGGHAENALPQSARAVVNCRILPQTDPAEVEKTLRGLAAPNDLEVKVVYKPVPSSISPMDKALFEAFTGVARELWPGIPVIPEMGAGASDGLYVRNAGIPTYGISAVAENPDDVRAHGRDERIRISAFDDALEYWYRLLKRLAGPPP